MPAHLIVGPPGTGKSTLTQQLSALGRLAIDMDTRDDLACWMNDADEPVRYQPREGWRRRHRFIWRSEELRSAIDVGLGSAPHLYVLGTATNAFDCAPMFDTLLFLHVEPRTLRDRLSRREHTSHPFKSDVAPPSEAELAGILESGSRGALRLGGRILEGELPPRQLAQRVIEMIGDVKIRR